MPVTYYIDPDGTSDCTGELEAIRAGFQTWEDLRFSDIDFTDGGTRDATDYINDGYNIVFWTPGNSSISWVGNTVTFSSSGHILGEDTAFNDYLTWRIGAFSGCWDVQSVATHEIGHWLHLDDLYQESNTGQTMYAFGSANSISMKSLEWGDENGAHYVYPLHNDAGSGTDGSNTIAGAGSILKGITYYGRLCDLPTPDHTLDTQDYYKFYAGSTSRLAFTLISPPNADFDLELYNPSGSLTDYSRNRANGGSDVITKDGGMGTTGWWTLRVYRYSTGGQGGNGQYSIKFDDMPLMPQP